MSFFSLAPHPAAFNNISKYRFIILKELYFSKNLISVQMVRIGSNRNLDIILSFFFLYSRVKRYPNKRIVEILTFNELSDNDRETVTGKNNN